MIDITVGQHKKLFKNGKPRNLHKRGSKYKIRKLRKKHICQKPDRKRIKSHSKITITYGECVVCLENKEMSGKNIIKCGNVSHVLCSGCKDKIKDNKCPLCRSHPIDPNKTQIVARRLSYDIYTPSILFSSIIRDSHTYTYNSNFPDNEIIYDRYPSNFRRYFD